MDALDMPLLLMYGAMCCSLVNLGLKISVEGGNLCWTGKPLTLPYPTQ